MSKIQVESIESTKTKEVKMKRRLLLTISLGLALILALAGLCGCSPSNTTLGTINLNTRQEGIWVSGIGEVTVTPDIATLRLGIQAQEASVAEAQTKASEAMNKVMTALTDSGVAEKDIQTQYFSIRQRTKWDREKEEETVVGYQVTNMVVAKIRDIDKVGSIIDAVAEAGGDLIRIDSIGFSVDDPSAYYQEAREEAMSDAKAKAEQLAELAGVTLGKPTYISEGAHMPPIYKDVYYEVTAGAPIPAPAPPPISPGETKITLTVQVAYSILQ